MNKKLLKLIKIMSSFFVVTFIIWGIIKIAFDIRLIYNFVDTIFFICFISSIIIWLVIFIKCSKKYKALKIIIISFVLVLSLITFGIKSLYSFLDSHVVMVASSPSKKNTLVILEGGFIDATYEAYPVKGYLFYQLQDNGYVSNHDDWGGSKITVTWENDNKAIVKIHSNFYPNEGSNKSNEIVVQFEQH